MNFSKIDRAIATCKKHLHDTKTANTQIASHLAGYLVVFISAEFELRVNALVEARAAKSNDSHIKSFVKHAARKIVRGPKIDQLTGLLECFDQKCPEIFHKTAGDQAKSAYDSIINHRHSFVHQAVCNATITDVERFFNDSRGVFAGLVAAFGLRAKEVAHLS